MNPRSKLTPKTAEEIFGLLRRGHYMRSAAAYVGIHKTTLYYWLELGNENRALADQKPVREEFETVADHRRALASWRAKVAAHKPYRDFADGVELARDFGEAWLVEQILDHASDQNIKNQKWTAYMTILERSRRERWAQRAAVEHTGPAGGTFEIKLAFDPQTIDVADAAE